ncbi:hypothetical protein [Bradyrhizobium sp. SSUT77]|uniref:hypothetical protein n=1 Tax=Bradyrhizobium sp. SSUT77 TaxID=3040603 RepID=UPI0024472164|nr:hypothetical protein [Bradyrhizobium sp. SSUT77]MDH2347267.1 hypothetical protein [Bradyrhizobium sp. SSUT77]
MTKLNGTRASRAFDYRRGISFLFAALLAICPTFSAHADDDDRDGRSESRAYAIGLWGDLPYSDLQAQVGVPNLIADMNAQKLAFVVNDGDLKAGNGTPRSVTPTVCSDALYQQGLGYFNALNTAATVTPGDNDWTDCDRAKNGSYSSRDRLDYERKLFFSTDYSLGQRPIKQQVQHDKLCLDHNNQLTGCVENRRWIMKGVVYATLNIQGSCNNLCDTAPDNAEWAARNSANIVWMQQTFEMARTYRASAVMFISQADPGWDLTDGTRAPLRDPQTLAETDGQPDGFQAFLVALRDEVVGFSKPVAYVHGDSHYFRIDRPFLDAKGQRLENFVRVETFGDHQENGNNDAHWLKVFVDDRSREVFAFQPQIVPGNRTAVPAPPKRGDD